MDSPLEPAFDRLTRLASRLLNAPVALMSLVDAKRQFIKSHIGWPDALGNTRHIPLSHSLCQHVVTTGKPLIVADTRLNPLVADNLAISDFNVIAYAGMPLEISTGEVIGSFCVIDTQPRQWSEEDLTTLKDLTASVVTEIELRAELIERQKVEAKLREQEDRYRVISALVSDYWYSLRIRDGVEHLEWIDGALAQVTGYSPAEIRQLGLKSLYLPEDMVVRMAARSMLSEKGQYAGEIRMRTKAGAIRWLHMSTKLTYEDGEQVIYEAFKDITQQKLTEQARLQSATQFQLIMQNTSDPVFLKDKQARYLLANRAFATLFHLTEAEIVGMNDIELFGETAAQTMQVVDNEIFISGQSKTYEGTRLIDGVERVFLTTKSLYFNEAGEVIGLVGITRDISLRKEIEIQLQQAVAKEQQLNELKSRFVSMLSHEFRTPLSTINTSVLILKDYADRLSPDKQRQKLVTIEAQIKRLTSLLDDILLIGKAETVGTDFYPTLIDLGEFCRTIIDEMTEVTTTHHFEFVLIGEQQSTLADPKLLRSILSNLLSNAVKYSPSANVVRLTLAYEANEVILRIRDEGIGIPANDLNQLFEAFHRGGNVGNIAGTGLGMVITQQAVHAHGGTLSCESEVGKGTTFQVKLPYDR